MIVIDRTYIIIANYVIFIYFIRGKQAATKKYEEARTDDEYK